MNEKTGQGTNFDRDEATMARLLRLAGPRPAIAEDIEQRVYERVRDEWQANSQAPDNRRVYRRVHKEWLKRGARGRRAHRWITPAAVAATVLLVVAVVLQPSPPTPQRVPVASIVRVVGDGAGTAGFAAGQQIFAGETLSVSDGEGLSLLLGGAESMRLDQNSTLVVNGKHDFSLVSGRIYADTGDFVYKTRGLVIDTPMGRVTDVGTQFAVTIGADRLDVAVREGRVDVTQASEVYVAIAGERMQVAAGEAAVVAGLAAHDAYWDWAISLAPEFDIENKSLLDFLRWASRETGRELLFATNEVRLAAMRVDLHGSVAGVSPLEAVELVLAGTTFLYRIEADRIVIEK